MSTIIILLIFSVFSCFNTKPLIDGDCDYREEGNNHALPNSAPSLLTPNAKNSLKGFEPIYISPDLEDILDQQQYNVYHEPVQGTILMPRIKFALNDDDDCIKREEDDYSDYVNIVNNVDPRYYQRRKGLKLAGRWRPVNRKPRYNPKIVPINRPVKIFPDPLYNPTIEEMIPYVKMKNTRDTYIVMADDPVLAVNDVPNIGNKCNKDPSGVVEVDIETTKANSEEKSTTINDDSLINYDPNSTDSSSSSSTTTETETQTETETETTETTTDSESDSSSTTDSDNDSTTDETDSTITTISNTKKTKKS